MGAQKFSGPEPQFNQVGRSDVCISIVYSWSEQEKVGYAYVCVTYSSANTYPSDNAWLNFRIFHTGGILTRVFYDIGGG